MYPISTAFAAALQSGSITIVNKAEVWTPGPLGVRLAGFNVETGSSITVDRAQAIRRRCSLILTDADGTLTPGSAFDMLAPFGNEIRLWRGLQYSDGSQELIPMGVYPIATTAMNDSTSDFSIQITGYDRARTVSRSKLSDYWVILRGENTLVAIQELLQFQLPWLQFSFTPTTATTPNLVLKIGDDAWQKALLMAKAIGYELFMDVNGLCVAQPIPNPKIAPISWIYSEGPTATILTVQRTLTSENIPNHIIRESQGSNTPLFRGEVIDNNPNSPTYLYGPYGNVVDYAASNLITDQLHATVAAQAVLNASLGSVETLLFTSITNPAHDIDDVVQVVRARSKVNNFYVFDQFNFSLGTNSALQATTRAIF